MLKTIKSVIAFLMTATLLPAAGFSLDIPRQDSKAQFFYIFGPAGNPEDGKEASNTFSVFVDVPESVSDKVTIKVFDPETGGKYDQGIAPFDTETEFSVLGASELDSKTFGNESEYDNKDYTFGPYEKTEGKKVGSYYRFVLKVRTLSGDDLNMFNVKVSPNTADVFSDKFTFVLLPGSGNKIVFYPGVPAGVKSLTVRNFDLDADGGSSTLRDTVTGKSYKVNDSQSGQWADTVIPINSSVSARFEYTVTTANQQNGHAGIQVLDDKGNALPVYFRKGPQAPKPAPVKKEKPAPAPAPAVNACNQFVFDARDSHDLETKNLSYEWNFGDGTSSPEPFVTHVYEKGGQYDVTLTVSDNSGLKCEKSTTSQKVNVNTPPSAELTGPQLACAGQEVSLDASGSSDENSEKLSYRWNLGDGTSADGARVRKVYEKGGVYNVSVTVDDNAGSSCSLDSAKHVIKINTPPTANAGSPVSMCLRNAGEGFNVSFNGSGSSDADHDNLKYVWDFGDGEVGDGARVSHQYKEAGEYTAKLTVSDNSGASCSTAVDSVPVKLNRAPVAVAGSDQSACTGSRLSFDASKSTVSSDNAVYTWNFGDGTTATGESVTHAFQKGGDYHVTLTVDDGRGTDCSTSTDSLKVRINGAPSASIEDVKASCTGDKVAFNASSSSDPDGNSLKYRWDFGDGTSAEGGSKVSHQYTKGGSYNVRVTVDDGSGSSCSASTDSTTVKVNTPPVANVGPNLACCTDETTFFDGTGSRDADGDSLAYRWSFGDGGTSNESKTEHAYAKSGSYPVKLTVDDGSGTQCSMDSAGFTANVNSKPVPVIKIKQK